MSSARLLLVAGLALPGLGAAPIPESPALEVLGAPETAPVRAGSPGHFGAQLRGLVVDGKLRPGAAFEATPWDLWLAKGTSYREYVERPMLRTLARASLSLATLGAAQGSEEIGAAVALRVRLWDDTDWRLNGDAVDCGRQLLREALLPPPDAPPDAGVTPQRQSALVDRLTDCRTRHVRWNASQAAVGVAALARYADGEVEGRAPDAWAGWLGAAWPAGEGGQVAASLRYGHDPGAELHDLALGSRYGWRHGGKAAAFEAGAGAGAGPEETVFEYRGAFSLSYRLWDELWLELKASWQGSGTTSEGGAHAGFSWGYAFNPDAPVQGGG